MKPIAVELGESVSPSLSGSKEGRHQGLSEKAVYGVVVSDVMTPCWLAFRGFSAVMRERR